MEVTETLLPGVGIRYELQTRSGQLLGIVVHRAGSVEMVAYDRGDRDTARELLTLEPEEVETVADLLGAPRMAQRFADLSREVPGLRSARLTVSPGSVFDGCPLGQTQARTRTGCSVVAVVRGGDVVTGPLPTEVLRGGDVLVVIGSGEGLAQLDALLGATS